MATSDPVEQHQEALCVPRERVIEAAKAWRDGLGDAADAWLTGDALALVRAVNELRRE